MHDPHTVVCPVLVRSFRVPCAYRRATDDHATMSSHCPPVTSLKLGRASEQSPSLFFFLSTCLAGSVCICLYDLQAEHQPWLRLSSSFSPTLFSPSFFFSAVPRRERSSQELHCPVVPIFGRALFSPTPSPPSLHGEIRAQAASAVPPCFTRPLAPRLPAALPLPSPQPPQRPSCHALASPRSRVAPVAPCAARPCQARPHPRCLC